MLFHIGPDLLHVIEDHLDILNTLFYNYTHNLGNLVIKYILLVFPKEFYKNLSFFVSQARYVAHPYLLQLILVG